VVRRFLRTRVTRDIPSRPKLLSYGEVPRSDDAGPPRLPGLSHATYAAHVVSGASTTVTRKCMSQTWTSKRSGRALLES